MRFRESRERCSHPMNSSVAASGTKATRDPHSRRRMSPWVGISASPHPHLPRAQRTQVVLPPPGPPVSTMRCARRGGAHTGSASMRSATVPNPSPPPIENRKTRRGWPPPPWWRWPPRWRATWTRPPCTSRWAVVCHSCPASSHLHPGGAVCVGSSDGSLDAPRCSGGHAPLLAPHRGPSRRRSAAPRAGASCAAAASAAARGACCHAGHSAPPQRGRTRRICAWGRGGCLALARAARTRRGLHAGVRGEVFVGVRVCVTLACSGCSLAWARWAPMPTPPSPSGC